MESPREIIEAIGIQDSPSPDITLAPPSQLPHPPPHHPSHNGSRHWRQNKHSVGFGSRSASERIVIFGEICDCGVGGGERPLHQPNHRIQTPATDCRRRKRCHKKGNSCINGIHQKIIRSIPSPNLNEEAHVDAGVEDLYEGGSGVPAVFCERAVFGVEVVAREGFVVGEGNPHNQLVSELHILHHCMRTHRDGQEGTQEATDALAEDAHRRHLPLPQPVRYCCARLHLGDEHTDRHGRIEVTLADLAK